MWNIWGSKIKLYIAWLHKEAGPVPRGAYEHACPLPNQQAYSFENSGICA